MDDDSGYPHDLGNLGNLRKFPQLHRTTKAPPCSLAASTTRRKRSICPRTLLAWSREQRCRKVGWSLGGTCESPKMIIQIQQHQQRNGQKKSVPCGVKWICKNSDCNESTNLKRWTWFIYKNQFLKHAHVHLKKDSSMVRYNCVVYAMLCGYIGPVLCVVQWHVGSCTVVRYVARCRHTRKRSYKSKPDKIVKTKPLKSYVDIDECWLQALSLVCSDCRQPRHEQRNIQFWYLVFDGKNMFNTDHLKNCQE